MGLSWGESRALVGVQGRAPHSSEALARARVPSCAQEPYRIHHIQLFCKKTQRFLTIRHPIS